MNVSRQSHEYAFGPAQLTRDELVVPHTAAGAIASLEEHQARLRIALDGLNDGDLLERQLTNWGEYAHSSSPHDPAGLRRHRVRAVVNWAYQ